MLHNNNTLIMHSTNTCNRTQIKDEHAHHVSTFITSNSNNFGERLANTFIMLFIFVRLLSHKVAVNIFLLVFAIHHLT